MNNRLDLSDLNFSRRTPRPQNSRPASHSAPSSDIKLVPCNPKCQGECMRCNVPDLSKGSASSQMVDMLISKEEEVLPSTRWKKGTSSKGGGTIYLDHNNEEWTYYDPQLLQQNQLRSMSDGQDANVNSGSVAGTRVPSPTQNLLNLLNHQVPQTTNKAVKCLRANRTSMNVTAIVTSEPTPTQQLSNQVPQISNKNNNGLQPIEISLNSMALITPGPTPTQQFSNPVPGTTNNQKPSGKSLDPGAKDFVPQNHHPRPRNPLGNTLRQQVVFNAQAQAQVQAQAQAQVQNTWNPSTQSEAYWILAPIDPVRAYNYSCQLKNKAVFSPLKQSYEYPTTHPFTQDHYGNNPRNVTWYIIQAIMNINYRNKITQNPAEYLYHLGLFLQKNWHYSSDPSTTPFSGCISVRDMFNIGSTFQCQEIYSIMSFLRLKYSDRDLKTCYFFLNLSLGIDLQWNWEGYGEPYLRLSLALVEVW